MADKMADWEILEILASWINWLFRLVKWEILPVLPSWELSGEGILANKAHSPCVEGSLVWPVHTTTVY